jgi:hypothetical protein
MNYDLSIPYKDDCIVPIGTISIMCKHYSELKFNEESNGMCCLQGKVKLEYIFSPPEPLHSLLTGDHSIRNLNNSCTIYTVVITHFK